MKISGSGRISEGKINDELIVSGSARIEGDFECNGFKSSGSLKGKGNLTVHGEVKSSGSFRLDGHLNSDGNARFSGSTTVGGVLLVKGVVGSSGSFRIGNKVEGLQGIRFSGSSNVKGDVLSQKTIIIEGSTTINGDIKGEDIYIGRERLLRVRKLFKHPYKVYGHIFAEKDVDLIGTYVDGDVRGRNVKIGRATEVVGTVYYIDSIEIDPKATLINKPVQISFDDTQNLK